jgi:hypothetical protein
VNERVYEKGREREHGARSCSVYRQAYERARAGVRARARESVYEHGFDAVPIVFARASTDNISM